MAQMLGSSQVLHARFQIDDNQANDRRTTLRSGRRYGSATCLTPAIVGCRSLRTDDIMISRLNRALES